MSPNIPGSVAKHSVECSRAFQGMLSSIPGNGLKYLGNVTKYSEKCRQTFRSASSDIPGTVFVTQGDEDAGSVQDFMEFAVQNIAWTF